jgi:hypothetical protein
MEEIILKSKSLLEMRKGKSKDGRDKVMDAVNE